MPNEPGKVTVRMYNVGFGDCFGHRFIENRTDDSTMHNALKPLPVLCWPPFCRDCAITPEHILNAQSVRVVLPANDAPVLRPCSETKLASAVIGSRWGGVLGRQKNIHLRPAVRRQFQSLCQQSSSL